eukprot:scpid55962/ scgid18143/ Phospholipase A2, taipoxin alpha chain; Phosphatidylcholine 2-acylhydrolase
MMKSLATVLAVALLAVQCVSALKEKPEDATPLRRSRRNVLNFGLMTKCSTDRNPLDYNQYGCHCGKGGSGTPVDATDTCCLRHDQCWAKVKRESSCQDGHFATYSWKCTVNRPTGCEQNTDACGRGFCMCDAEAATCFARHRYSEQYRNWNGECRARNPTPAWYNVISKAMQAIPANLIPHLGKAPSPAAAAQPAAAPGAQPGAGPGAAQPAALDPVLISLPGTGPDAPGNPNPDAGAMPATNPLPPGQATEPPPVTRRPAPARPVPERPNRQFTLPNIIGNLIGRLPWKSIFGKK